MAIALCILKAIEMINKADVSFVDNETIGPYKVRLYTLVHLPISHNQFSGHIWKTIYQAKSLFNHYTRGGGGGGEKKIKNHMVCIDQN